jgi:dTDP-4-amino-4,6-dideoxygalactose transaminase
MDSIQGAVLSVKLHYIEGWNAARNMVAEHYGRNFGELENLTCPVTPSVTYHVYHTYVVRVPDRENFMSDMQSEGIATAIHYPVPIHLEEAYQFLPHQEGGFPIAETWASEVVSLPMFPELHFRQVARVIDAVKNSRASTRKIYFESEQFA